MTANELIQEIANGIFTDEEVKTLWEAVKEAHRATRERSVRSLRFTLKSGDYALIQNIRPKGLNGLKVKIENINKTSADVTLPEVLPFSVRQRAGGPARIPLACLTPVPKEAP